jgi:putative NADH-flavin reductase
MKIALFGASGMIGQRIAKEAGSRGHTVTALSSKDVDARDAAAVEKAIAGHDVVVCAIGPKHAGGGPAGSEKPEMLTAVAKGLVGGVKGRPFIVVGGAGSLEVAPGKRLVDTPEFPAAWKPVALAAATALDVFKSAPSTSEWTYVSPAAFIEPGERTGKYRLGTDQLLLDDKGAPGRISAEDFAVAIIDEIEAPKHKRKRFTVAW